jgi:hypoxanthine-DNA glycosylase
MIYSFEPIIDKKCKIMILGTMPGIESLRKQEYYAHRQNVFWRVIYALFDREMEESYDNRKTFLLEHNIALWDVLKACNRKGSSDSDIKNPVVNDFLRIYKEYKNIRCVFFNGTPAERLYKKYVTGNSRYSGVTFNKSSAQGIIYHKLLSTSPANASYNFSKKLENWKTIKGYL